MISSVIRSSLILVRNYSNVPNPNSMDRLQAKLRKAIAWRDEDTVKYCIEQGAPINRQDVNANDGHNDYHIVRASYLQDKKIVKLLLNAKADPDVACEHGHTPLMILSERGNAELVKVVLAAGANVHKVDSEGMNAVLTACRRTHNPAEIINLLLPASADVTHICNQGNNGLMHLLENSAIGSYFSWDHANTATYETMMKVIQLCDVNIANKKGLTPLMLTISKDYFSFVEPLLKKGADRLTKDKKGQNSIEIAAKKVESWKAKMDNHKVIMQDISKAASKECKKISGNTDKSAVNDLSWAIYENKTSKVAQLLSQGIDPNQENELEERPIKTAIRNGNPKIVELLLNAHAEVNVKDRYGSDITQLAEHYLQAVAKNVKEATKALNQLKMHD